MLRGGMRVLALITVMVMCGRFAYADRIGDLTAMLSSSPDKTRLSAVVSLAKLGDKRALKPLVTALHDPNAQVRALAATGLGKLAHKAALPELEHVATDATDDNAHARAKPRRRSRRPTISRPSRAHRRNRHARTRAASVTRRTRSMTSPISTC